MMSRLHFTKIISIGTGPDKPARIGRRVSLSPAAGWGKVVERIAADRLDEQQSAINKIRDDYQRIGNGISEARNMTPVTAESIADAVAKKAVTLRAKSEFWDKSDAELRVEIWKRTPGLRDAYTAAMRDPDGFAKSKSSDHAEALATVRSWKDDTVGLG